MKNNELKTSESVVAVADAMQAAKPADGTIITADGKVRRHSSRFNAAAMRRNFLRRLEAEKAGLN